MAENTDGSAARAGLGALRTAFRLSRRLTWEVRQTGDKAGLAVATVQAGGLVCAARGAGPPGRRCG